MSSPYSATLSSDLRQKVSSHLQLPDAGTAIDQLDNDRIAWAVADVLGIPMVPLARQQVAQAAYFSRREFWHEVGAVPLFEHDVLIQVAVTRPWDVVLHRQLITQTARDVRLVGASESDIAEVLGAMWSAPVPPEPPRETISAEEGLTALNYTGETIPWFKRLVLLCRTYSASDIHFSPFTDRLSIRARIRGELEAFPPLSPKHTKVVLSDLKAFAGIPTNEPNLFHDGKARIQYPNEEPVELRVSSGPTPDGESIVFRILDPNKMKKQLGQLPFGGKQGEILRSHMEKGQGLIFVTGPTGSGKTTTLYKILFCIDRHRNAVKTIEQPVEYRLPNVDQFEILESTGFKGAVKYLMRQDPDIVLVGEIRDVDTAEACSELALTGHLVFSTLHVTSAPEAVERMRGLRVPNDIVAATMSLSIAQRLIPRLCPKCRRKVPTALAVAKHFEHRKLESPTHVYERVGCKECMYLGIVGVLPIFELFEPNDEIKELIKTNQLGGTIQAAWEADGGQPLVVHGLRMVSEGITPYSEVAIYESNRRFTRN